MILIDRFKSRIPELATLAKQPNRLVPYLTYFLEEHEGLTAIKGSDVAKLFDNIRVRCPNRMSDAFRTRNFIPGKGGGYKLSHAGRQYVEVTLLPPSDDGGPSKPADLKTPAAVQSFEEGDHSRDVFVVYGRDGKIRSQVFMLLRAMGLHPLEFSEVVQLSGVAAPYTWDAIKIAFSRTQACVVLFTPDEHVRLRRDLQLEERDGEGWQARPNVYIEAGMALAVQPQRTVLVNIGNPRPASDLSGMQYIGLSDSSTSRNKLLNALKTAGCDVRGHGDDWLTEGNFEIPKEKFDE